MTKFIGSDRQKDGKMMAAVRKAFFALGVSFIVGASFSNSPSLARESGQNPRAVIELFTSQGCSSCPAADKILAQYAAQKDVLALSFHVDYWNYLGWKDTFSKAKFTERQQRYAVSFQRRQIYTPQAVVNGRDHVVGSRGGDVQALIDSYQKSGKGLSVPVKVTRNSKNVRLVTNETTGDATVLLVYYNKKQTVKITRGENRGKTIAYHNVVGDVALIGMMKGGKLDVSLPLSEMKRQGYDACAVVLQQDTRSGTPGSIVGAAVIEDF